MAAKKMKELQSMAEKDREKKLSDLRLELAKERANISIGATVTSPGKIREMRKAIARLKALRASGGNEQK